MKTAHLFFTVSIPVHYDERHCTEQEALDVTQKVAEAAIARACDGRSLDTTGKHIDCTGLRLVAAPPSSEHGPKEET